VSPGAISPMPLATHPHRMHITYLGPVPPLRGGIPQHGAQLVSALVRMGHEVSVEGWSSLYPRRLYPVTQDNAPLGHRPAFTTAPSHLATNMSWSRPWSWWSAGRHARRTDLLVFPWWVPAQAPAVRTFLTAAGTIPKVGMMHDVVLPNRHRGDLVMARMALRPITGAVVHNSHVAEQVRSLLPHIEPDAITLVPHPPNLAMTPRPMPPAPPLRLLVFGHVRSYKGLELVLEAVAELATRGTDARLTVAGQFWEPLEPWEQRINHLGLAGKVDLRNGYVPDDDLDDLFASHHLVVTPYRSASQSGVIPLASSAARPSVVTPVGGLPEQVTDGVDGVVAAGVSPTALADAIAHAATSLDALSSGALRSSASWEDVAAAVINAGRRKPH
jgi:glycosyltransferase involved in cell wall biosynthesis